MLNDVYVIGNLTSDGNVFEDKETKEFLFYTNRIAINENTKNKKITTFIDIKINNKKFQSIIPYLKKGKKVFIKGALREKTNKKSHKFYYIKVNKLIILNPKDNNKV